jgi:branched-chain amino acid transport system permease protein
MDLLLHHFWELTITGLAFGAIYALVALGYTLVYGVLRLINFAHSEVFMYGSFAAVWVLLALGAGKSTGLGLVGFLIIGFVAKIAILWTIGIILVVIGVILAVLGMMGRAVGGRAHYY